MDKDGREVPIPYIIGSAVWKNNPYSSGIDFSRQDLTSVDVRFWRLK